MPLAKGSPYMAVRRGTEFNSWHNVVVGLQKSPHFTLISGAHVKRLNWDSPTGRVATATYLDRDSGAALRLPAHPMYMTRSADQTAYAASWTIGLASSRDRPLTYIGRHGSRFGVQVFGTMDPTPDHRVSVGTGTSDELGQLPLDIHFGYEQETIDEMHSARQRLADVFDGAGNAAVIDGADIALTPGESVHFGGSVRMHARPEYGMVDADCRLHDAPNVSVVDTSVFTTGPEKNPTLTAMAIAARAMASVSVA